jgi:hypothetical protein
MRRMSRSVVGSGDPGFKPLESALLLLEQTFKHVFCTFLEALIKSL